VEADFLLELVVVGEGGHVDDYEGVVSPRISFKMAETSSSE
jgi:hypothetical protein